MRVQLDERSYFEWTSTSILGSHSFICAGCGSSINAHEGYIGKYSDGRIVSPRQIYLCYVCSKPNFFDSANNQWPKYKGVDVNFSEEIKRISPRFIKVYEQSMIAEENELDEIDGVGLRKALEILVKDYLIDKSPDDAVA